MPSLTTVTLNEYYAFSHIEAIQTKSYSSSSPSFLDITPALQQYLSFHLSFTHNSSYYMDFIPIFNPFDKAAFGTNNN